MGGIRAGMTIIVVPQYDSNRDESPEWREEHGTAFLDSGDGDPVDVWAVIATDDDGDAEIIADYNTQAEAEEHATELRKQVFDLDNAQVPACLVLCGHCLTEQWVAVNEIGRCPQCRNYVFPCGACDTERDGCGWDKDTGCRKFPGVKTPIALDAGIRTKDGRTGVIAEYDCEDDSPLLEKFRAYHVDFGDETGWEIVYPQDIEEVL